MKIVALNWLQMRVDLIWDSRSNEHVESPRGFGKERNEIENQ
jgi:hypothetical protein